MGTASLDVNKKDLDLNIYPNPTNSSIQMNFDLDNQNTSVQITNLSGQVVYQSELGTLNGEQIINIELSDFENGVYLLTLHTNDINITRRVTVNK